MAKRDDTPATVIADDVDELDALLEAAHPDAKIAFYRYGPSSLSWEYLVQLGIPDVQAIGIRETTRERFGGGRFKARLRVQGKMGKSASFHIAGDPKATPAAAAIPLRESSTADVASSSSSDELMELMKRRMLERMFDPPPPPKPALSLVEIAALVTALTPLITAMINRGASKDPMELATKIGELIANSSKSGGPRGDMSELIGAVNDLMEIKDRIADSRGPAGDPMGEFVKTVGPHVVEAFTRTREPARATPPAPAQIAASTSPATSPSPSELPVSPAPSSPTSTEPAWVSELRVHVSQLVKVASSGRDPRNLANALFDFFLPDRHKGVLRELVAQETAEQQLVDAFPELAPYTAWLSEFVDELRVIFGFVATGDDDGAST